MPADTNKATSKDSYYHIYNKGRDAKAIFTDDADYDTFIGFLEEYLSSPSSTPVVKKTFTVKGKTYQGVPHLPKNYHNKVELVAYSLIPSSFSVLVKVLEEGALESFIRSLSTRYSIYFNKKYQSSGSLFDRPCKSLKIDSESIDLLTFYFHKNGTKTSLSKYLNTTPPSWAVVSGQQNSYEEIIKKYEFNQTQKERLNNLVFQKISSPVTITKEIPVNQNIPISINSSTKKSRNNFQRVPELLFASTLFFVLVILALKNITTPQTEASQKATENVENNIISTPTPDNTGEVAGTSIDNNLVTISSNDEFTISVYDNTVKSTEIAKLKLGEKVELVERDLNWAEIKLSSGTIGFIETKYID